MTDTPLITLDDIREVRKIAANYDQDKTDNFIQLAQTQHLRPLIGAGLYYDLLQNITAPNYVKLINGDTYTDRNGDTVQYYGLKPYLAYFWLAVYTREGNSQQTEIGTIEFVNDNVTRESVNRRDLEKSYQTTGNSLGNEILEYLEAKKQDFPLYKSKTESNPTGLTFDII